MAKKKARRSPFKAKGLALIVILALQEPLIVSDVSSSETKEEEEEEELQRVEVHQVDAPPPEERDEEDRREKVRNQRSRSKDQRSCSCSVHRLRRLRLPWVCQQRQPLLPRRWNIILLVSHLPVFTYHITVNWCMKMVLVITFGERLGQKQNRAIINVGNFRVIVSVEWTTSGLSRLLPDSFRRPSMMRTKRADSDTLRVRILLSRLIISCKSSFGKIMYSLLRTLSDRLNRIFSAKLDRKYGYLAAEVIMMPLDKVGD